MEKYFKLSVESVESVNLRKGGKLPLALYSRVKSFRLGEGVLISNEVYSKAYYKTLIL